jgi:hypothetical protein
MNRAAARVRAPQHPTAHAILAFLALSLLGLPSPASSSAVSCDIIVAGGSLAGSAAAISAAQTSPELHVCHTDITDWPGGQATASATSAIDFGANWINFPSNVPKSFGDMLLSPGFGNATFNPGGCTVSHKCFLPSLAVEWLLSTFSSFPNLSVFLNTAVVGATKDNTTGRVVGVRAVQRTPTASYPNGYERLTSEALPDWYSPQDSAYFTKTVLDLTLSSPSAVVIDATEFGDVLMNVDGVVVAQGMEVPDENSFSYDQSCGQTATVCFWISWAEEQTGPDTTPYGNDEGYVMPHTWTPTNLPGAFTWRRSFAVDPLNTSVPRIGDTFLINEELGNDLLNSQMLLPLADARQQVLDGQWMGGVNLTALAMAEQRAYGYYWSLRNGTSRVFPEAMPYFALNRSAAGTANGLAKLPYLRETRRAQRGIQDFRLCSNFASVDHPGPGGPGCYQPSSQEVQQEVERKRRGADAEAAPDLAAPKTGFRWVDTCAIGSYGYDFHHQRNCTIPSYANYTPDPYPALPYYLPVRALTVADVPNLLVAGRTMAQTFLANAVTRLHPTEWSSGTAAGVAAAAMVTHGWDSLQMYINHTVLQGYLDGPGSPIQSPLEWNLTSPGGRKTEE